MRDEQPSLLAITPPRADSKEFDHLLKDLYFRLDERDNWYDQAIKYLLYGNGSAVALTSGMIAALYTRGADPGWLWVALPFFFGGIFCVGYAIYQSAECAAKGRAEFRNMLSGYLENGKPTYLQIFLRLPEIRSKYGNFSRLCICSASFFALGATSMIISVSSMRVRVQEPAEQVSVPRQSFLKD